MCQNTQVVRPEGAEAHSPGQRPGYIASKSKAPCKGKSVHLSVLLPLQGALFITTFVYPGRCPGLGAIWAFSPYYLTFDTPSFSALCQHTTANIKLLSTFFSKKTSKSRSLFGYLPVLPYICILQRYTLNLNINNKLI